MSTELSLTRCESLLLDGVAVAEVSSSVAGAYAGRLLAAMGASVTYIAAETHSAAADEAAPLLDRWLTSGKTELNRDDPAVEAVLATASMVVVEIDPGHEIADYAAELAERAAALPHRPIVVVLRHGVEGADAKAIPGTGLTVSAWSGMSWSMGYADAVPLSLPYDIGAYQGGIHACAAGLAALIALPEDALLRRVDVASRDVVAYFTGMITANFIPYERKWAREGARPPQSAGVYPASIFPCKDGHVVLMCRSQKEWDIFVEGMGTPEWSRDDRFHDPRVIARLHADEVDQHLNPWILERTQQELLDFGTRLGLPIAPVRTVREAIEEPQLFHRGYLGKLGDDGLTVPTNPWQVYEVPDAPAKSDARPWPLSPESCGSTSNLLKGLRVLDLSWVWSGPLVTSVLADLGAEVIKIEHTDNMDSSRTRGRARRNGVEVEGPEHEATPYFNQMNHGKLSVTMNLKEKRARALLLDLAEHCDVVVENMRPGAMRRLGLTYEALAERNPGVVLLSMSMAGQNGPLSSMKGYAGVMAAMSGLESLIGYDNDNIVGSLAAAIGDPNASGHALNVLFAALYRRRETGKGAWIDLSQTEALMNVLPGPIIEGQLHDEMTPPGNRHPRWAPHGHLPCAGDDRWAALAIRSNAEWDALVDLATGADLGGRENWSTAEGRLRDVAAVEEVLAAWTRTQDRDVLVRRLLDRGIAAAPVASFEDLITSDWKAERGLTAKVEHPYLGTTEVFLMPWRFDGQRPDVPTPGPLLGSSTEAVLGHLLGLPVEDVARLRADRVLY